MHALNTNGKMKMKKISYYGKEYTVGDDIKWVATSSSGNVLVFTDEPVMYCDTWVTYESGKRIGIWGGATKDWKNSPRKVEDIIVSENTPAPSGHPHADLMLKYAMIAQHDDKPWEHFECQIGAAWYTMRNTPFCEEHDYRLKPQEPVVQVGQTWFDGNGIAATVTNAAAGIVTVSLSLAGDTIYWTFLIENFLKNFKRKN